MSDKNNKFGDININGGQFGAINNDGTQNNTFNAPLQPATSEPSRIDKSKQAPVSPVTSANKSQCDKASGEGVFISYSRRDEAQVKPVVEELIQRGIKIWWDQMNIPVGANWRDELNGALVKSKCLLLFMSEPALNSSFVKEEYRYYLNNHKPFFPVLLQPGLELPPELQSIQYQSYQQIQTVVDTVCKCVASGSK